MLRNIEWESGAVDVSTFIKSIFFATVSLLPALGGNNRTVKQWARPGQHVKCPAITLLCAIQMKLNWSKDNFPPPTATWKQVPVVDDPCPRCKRGHTVMDEHDVQKINIKRPEWVEECDTWLLTGVTDKTARNRTCKPGNGKTWKNEVIADENGHGESSFERFEYMSRTH